VKWVAGVLLVSFVFSVVASGATSRRPVFLVVAFSPSSSEMVAHTYDRTGHLIHTVAAPAGSNISWSPDGSQVALADTTGLWVERADGTQRRQLLETKTVCTAVCLSAPTVVWSPDGKTLAVGGVDPITTGFVHVDVSSGRVSQVRIAKRGTRYIPIAYSPNGKLLAYATDKDTRDEALLVCNADGSKSRLLHQFHDHHDGPGVATWSPDSTRLAFTDDGRDARDPNFGIIDVATARLHAIAPHQPIYDQSPAWSPSGSRLAVGRFKGKAFTISANGAGMSVLAITASGALWLRNGDLVLTRGTNGHSFAILRAAHGQPRALFTLPYREVLYTPLRAAT
jgi:Tol biopolymer transport system component